MTIEGAVYVSVGLTVFTALIAIRDRKRMRHDANRYNVFAVRDQLICTVASGLVPESDELFQLFYGRLNALANRHAHVNAWSFAQAIANSFRSDGEEQSREAQLIGAAPREMQEVVLAAYDCLLAVFNTNSVLIRGMCKGGPMEGVARFLLAAQCFVYCLFTGQLPNGSAAEQSGAKSMPTAVTALEDGRERAYAVMANRPALA